MMINELAQQKVRKAFKCAGITDFSVITVEKEKINLMEELE